MNPGKLNTRIIIKQLIKSADGFGGFTNTVTTYATIWGDVKQISGKRDTNNGQRSTKTQVEGKIKFNTQVFHLITFST